MYGSGLGLARHRGITTPDLGCKGLERTESNSAGGTSELLSRGAHSLQPQEILADRLGKTGKISPRSERTLGELKGHQQQGAKLGRGVQLHTEGTERGERSHPG